MLCTYLAKRFALVGEMAPCRFTVGKITLLKKHLSLKENAPQYFSYFKNSFTMENDHSW